MVKNKKDIVGCKAKLDSYGWHEPRHCGKPAKGVLINGVRVCGIHLRQEKMDVERKIKNSKERKDKKCFVEQVKKFASKHGFDSLKPLTSMYGREIKDRVMVSFKELQDLMSNRVE